MGNEPNNSQSNKEKKYIYIAIAGAVLLLVLFLLFRDKDTETSVEEDFIANPPAEQIIPPTSTPSSTAKPLLSHLRGWYLHSPLHKSI